MAQRYMSWPYGDYAQTYFHRGDLAFIATAAFDHVRIPLDDRLLAERRNLRKLDEILRAAAELGVDVMLDGHRVEGHEHVGGARAAERDAFWQRPDAGRALAEHWLGMLDSLPSACGAAIDLLNEPTITDAERWAELVHEAVGTIRCDYPELRLVVECANKASPFTFAHLPVDLEEPVVFSFHFYEPWAFTHQNAFWSSILPWSEHEQGYPGELEPSRVPVPDRYASNFDGSWDGRRIDDLLETCTAPIRGAGKAVYCGEFGAYSMAPLASRRRWTADVVAGLERLGIGWSYWTYKNMGFGLRCDIGPFDCNEEYVDGIDRGLLRVLQGAD